MFKNLTPPLLAGLIAVAAMLTAAEPPPTPTPNNAVADLPKITHDWPAYTGNDGTYADLLTRVPLLDDLSQAELVWTSEHDGLGYGKTSSGAGTGQIYGPKRKLGGMKLILKGLTGTVAVTAQY